MKTSKNGSKKHKKHARKHPQPIKNFSREEKAVFDGMAQALRQEAAGNDTEQSLRMERENLAAALREIALVTDGSRWKEAKQAHNIATATLGELGLGNLSKHLQPVPGS